MEHEFTSTYAGDQDLEKIVILLPRADWHNHGRESLWAEPIGEDLFRIKNVPFYAEGYAYDDIVHAPRVKDELIVDHIVQRSGHSTYLLFLNEDPVGNSWVHCWEPLQELGCSYERATNRLFAVDVPPATDIYQAYKLFEIGKDSGIWDFQENYCGHSVKR